MQGTQPVLTHDKRTKEVQRFIGRAKSCASPWTSSAGVRLERRAINGLSPGPRLCRKYAGRADRSLAARLAISPAKSRQLCRHTDLRPRRRGRHIGVYLADFFDVFVE